ncbi:gap junction alpha-4 protein [Chanos chanos]|uniref:Gap junction protein n=1 Tax=Chanos chanos TaxID=29144 RepID=A0A6J2WPQ3_CHACN|nr:gap junction Cx32.2 protein-like [Chanos chanos]
MSRADWTFLEHLLGEGQEYSTNVGRVWLTVLFLFRMLVLGIAAESAWDDERSNFICDTKQPGCESVCYDKAFPVSHFRYFVLQVVFVSTPTIFYFGYVAIHTGKQKKQEEGEKERSYQRDAHPREGKLEVIEEVDEVENGGAEGRRDGRKNLPEPGNLKGRILCAYASSIFMKILLEVGFIVGLWFLYGFVVEDKFVCKRDPCPHRVNCYVSRPTEKTIFTIYTQIIAAISVLLNIIELFHLLQIAIMRRLTKKYQTPKRIKLIEKTPSRLEPAMPQAPPYQEKAHLFLPIGENSYSQSELDWSVRDSPSSTDMLPSYSNCINNVRSTSRKSHSKKHSHSKQSKSTHKGNHSKQTQYV